MTAGQPHSQQVINLTRRRAASLPRVAEDLALLNDGAQAARLVRADLPGVKVPMAVYSRNLSLLPSRGARRISAMDLCRRGRLRPIIVVASCERRGCPP